MKSALDTRLQRFFRKLERNPGNYERLLPETWPPLQVYLGQRRPRLLLYCTKEVLLRRWGYDDVLPPDSVALSRYGLPTAQYLDELQHHIAKHRLPLLFIGDLDPLDLTIFSILRREVGARYLGINDAWLSLCGTTVEKCFIPIGALEREHWTIAKQLLPDADRLVGPRCFALLESGQKLELEGAANPGIHGKNFSAVLMRHLRRRATRMAHGHERR